MKHISSDTYTVAWFKLAECVTRGEKERAFGVYRLLSHSLDDRALALQLEGDLFLAFDMTQEATASFEKAAQRYKQAGRLLETASVYEHICFLNPYELAYKKELLYLYCQLQYDTRVTELACALVQAYSATQKFDAIRGLAQSIEHLDSFAMQALCYEKMVYTLISGDQEHNHVRIFYVEHMIAALLRHGNDILLQQALQRLKHTDEELYHGAVNILEKQ